jgi:hypothetical protein
MANLLTVLIYLPSLRIKGVKTLAKPGFKSQANLGQVTFAGASVSSTLGNISTDSHIHLRTSNHPNELWGKASCKPEPL